MAMKFVLSTKFGNQEAGDDTTCAFNGFDNDDVFDKFCGKLAPCF